MVVIAHKHVVCYSKRLAASRLWHRTALNPNDPQQAGVGCRSCFGKRNGAEAGSTVRTTRADIRDRSRGSGVDRHTDHRYSRLWWRETLRAAVPIESGQSVSHTAHASGLAIPPRVPAIADVSSSRENTGAARQAGSGTPQQRSDRRTPATDGSACTAFVAASRASVPRPR